MWKPYEEGGAIYPHYTFTYDPIGNRLTREATDSSGTIQKEYDANVLNQYESITNPAQALDYDADGNLTDDGSWTYTWDGAGRHWTCQWIPCQTDCSWRTRFFADLSENFVLRYYNTNPASPSSERHALNNKVRHWCSLAYRGARTVPRYG